MLRKNLKCPQNYVPILVIDNNSILTQDRILSVFDNVVLGVADLPYGKHNVRKFLVSQCEGRWKFLVLGEAVVSGGMEWCGCRFLSIIWTESWIDDSV